MSLELKIKEKSLAAEAKIIKKEESKCLKSYRVTKNTKYLKEYNNLYRHRIDVVRAICRATNLARAYIKGLPFVAVEGKKPLHDVPINAILKMVQKYHDKNITYEDIKNWIIK